MADRAAPLDGRTALVTGATRGIGEAVSRALAAAGARVVAVGRDRHRLRAVAEAVGGRSLNLDLTDAGAVEAGMAALLAEGPPPDILVNSAGVFDLAPLASTPVEVLDRNLSVNLRGSFLAIRALLPAMLARGSGLIVNVGSVSGRRAFPENGAYAASKFGLRGMHEVLLEELRGTGVRASLVEPGAVDTPIWDPMDPDRDPGLPARAAMLRAEDVAQAVVFLATRPAHVTVPLLQIERA